MYRLLQAICRCSMATRSFPIKTESYFVFRKQPLHHTQFLRNIQFAKKRSRVRKVDPFSAVHLDHCINNHGFVTRTKVEKAVAKILRKGCVSKGEFSMIIRCCGSLMAEECPQKRVEYVHKFWNSICSLGVKLEICHYNALLKTYMENDHSFSPTELLNSFEAKRIELDAVTYEYLIAKYAEEGDLDNVLRMVTRMRAKNMTPSSGVISGVILCHFRRNDVETAEDIIRSILPVKDNICPTDTFVQLVRCLIELGKIDKVMQLMRDNHLTRDVKLFEDELLEILYTLGKSGYHDEFDEILSCVTRSAIYNVKAVKFMYKFLFDENFECAYKLMKRNIRIKAITEGFFVPLGTPLIKFLVEHDKPASVVTEYCEKLSRDDLNTNALSDAIKFSLQMAKEKLAVELLKAYHQEGNPMRPHYFWPLLACRGAAKDDSGVLNVMSVMMDECKVTPCAVTLCEFVIPCVHEYKNVELIIDRVKASGGKMTDIVGALVIRLLNEGEMEKAANLVENDVAAFSPYSLRESLLRCYRSTKDHKSFLKIVKAVGEKIIWPEDMADVILKGDEEEAMLNYSQFVDETMEKVIVSFVESGNDAELECFLKDVLDSGIRVSANAVIKIFCSFDENVLPKFTTLVNSVTDDEAKELSDDERTAFDDDRLNSEGDVAVDYRTFKRSDKIQ